MFRNKSEVDKHVGKLLSRISNSTEKNQESLKISKLYFDLKEYSLASMYLANYLGEFSLDSLGWKLRAEIAELSEKNWLEAAEYYSQSFSLNESDTKVLLKICNCYLNANIDYNNIQKPREYLIKAEKYYPFEKVVIDLKEKLLHLNDDNNTICLDDTLENLADKGQKILDWEQFLIKAIDEDYSNEDLHLKLIKIYFKNEKINKLFRYILKLESRFQFISSRNWYSKLISLVETNFNKFKTDHTLSSSQLENLEYLNIVLIILINHYMLMCFENSVEKSLIVEQLLKFDKYLHVYELSIKEKSLPYQKLVLNEFKAQFLYVCAILFMQTNANMEESDDSPENNVFKVCMIKSLLISRPNNVFFNQYLEKSVKKLNNDDNAKKEIIDLIVTIHNDSAWRFSIIGNWLKFILKSIDDVDYFKSIQLIDSSSIEKNLRINFKNTLAENVSSSFLHNLDNSFLHISDKEKFQILNVNDTNFIAAIDHADKYCLANQSHNLKFLVWHTLANTDFSASTSYDLYEILPYFYFRQTTIVSNNTQIRFGVENLNVCNLESLSILDMKIFLYLTSFQAISFLKQQNTIKSVNFLPFYWLVASNLCTDQQQEWWRLCYNLLFNSKEKKITEIDSKKQNKLTKILELIRLKSNLIKFNTEEKNLEKYKLNIKVCIMLVKYLQYLIETLKNSTKSEPLYASFVHASSELFFTPREKLKHLKKFKIAYWNFVCKQLIKLRQLSIINDQSFERLDSSVLTSSNKSILNSSLSISEHGSCIKIEEKTQSQIKDYFDYFERQYEVNKDNKENLNLNFDYDSIILTGLLNLILNCVQCENENEIDGNISDDVELVHGFHVTSIQNLTEAISLFHLMENKCLDDSQYINDAENAYKFNFFQLQLCKKIAESLIDQRRHIEHLRQNNMKTFLQENYEEKLEKIYILIDFLKKKINLSFEKNNELLLTDKTNIANTSITESLQKIDFFLKESEIKLNEEFEIIELNQVKNDFEQDTTEIEKTVQIEVEKIGDTKKEIDQLVVAQVQTEEIQKEEACIKTEKIEAIIMGNMQNIKIEIDQREAELKKEEEERQKNELLKKEIEIKLRSEFEARLKQEATELKLKQQLEYNKEQNQKVLKLIQTMRNQKWEHTRLNIDILQEQFDFIQSQLKQINYEINHISKCREKRLKSLSEFHEIVLNFDKLCDIKSFTAQFNVFYWLFQQQPSMGEYFLNQQHVKQQVQYNKEMELKQQQTQQLNLPKDDSYTLEDDYEDYDEENDNDNEETQEEEEEEENDYQDYQSHDPTNAHCISAAKDQQTRSETSGSFHHYQTPEGVNSEKRSSKNKDKSVSSSTSMSYINSDIKSKNVFFNKTIGDIQFPNNLDVLSSIKTSASKYLLELSNEKIQEDEEENQNSIFPCSGNTISTNYSSQNKADTFLSCNDGDENSFFDIVQNNSNLNATKSSINDLQIMFDNYGIFYNYCDSSKSWILGGKCNMQIIVDEMSDKGNYQAFFLCTILDNKNSYKFQLSKNINVINFKDNSLACCWYDKIQSCSRDAKTVFNCGAIQFEEESILTEFKRTIADCQSKMKNNENVLVIINNSFSWQPPDSLPQQISELNSSKENLNDTNNIQLEFERQITFNLNGIINYQCVSINLYTVNSLSKTDFYLISIQLDTNIFFKHYVKRDQKFEINSPAKKNQFSCKYKLSRKLIIIDNLTVNEVNEERPCFDIKLTFTSKAALSEFLGFFN